MPLWHNYHIGCIETQAFVRINGLEIIDELISKYPKALNPARRWTMLTLASRWKNFVEVQKTFNAADYVAPYTVFDIGGNKWRVITIVEYAAQLIVVTHALTHAEYEKGKWK
jgi:mRNA interferase HigB